MRPEVNSNQFEISNCFEKCFCLHDDFAMATFQTVVRFIAHAQMILAPLLAIIKTKRESTTTCDCMKAREIYNNIRVVTNQTSVFKDYQHEPRSNQSNTNMCWLSCFISCNVSCFPERASSMNRGRKILQ